MDIQDAYRLLSAEWRSVFDLYAHGLSLQAIHRYFLGLRGRRAAWPTTRGGDKIVRSMVRRVMHYLGYRLVRVSNERLDAEGRWK